MTPEEIDLCEDLEYLSLEDKRKIARLMEISKESELTACAEIAEKRGKLLDEHAELAGKKELSTGFVAYNIAQAIRARGEKTPTSKD